jgi:hypothetical protein
MQLFGAGEVNIGSYQGAFLGQEKLILGQNKMNYGTKQVDF